MDDLETKYIDLLLNKCVNFEMSNSLFVNYIPDNAEFVLKLTEQAKQMGISDIYLKIDDPYETHDILNGIAVEEIESHPYFNNQIWDEYAHKNASFIMLKSEVPNLMDDISADKLAKARYVDRITRPVFKRKQGAFQIPWCYAVLPNKKWADKLFPNDDNSYNKLFELICRMCMVDTDNPIKSWDDYLANSIKWVDYLNDLNIKTMHYQNSLGTDLHIELPQNSRWQSAANLGENMFVNMPSYEIFNTPNMYKTNGIVYSSRPLIYSGGRIDGLFIEFKDGKAINYGAKVGKEILKGIITSDELSSYLGEVALVNDDSPISNTGLVFDNTLFDENASCHLALGSGFPKCIKNGEKLNKDQLIKMGINTSNNHIDFMIGSPDLNIEANTRKGKVLIFKNGNFNI